MVPDGQRRPPGDPAGRTVVAHGRQCSGGALRQAEQPGCVRQRHLLPGLDTPTDEGEDFKLAGKPTSDPKHVVSFMFLLLKGVTMTKNTQPVQSC